MLTTIDDKPKSKTSPASYSRYSDTHRAAMWLDAEVKKAQRMVTTQVVDLTPALAEVLLERNPENRKQRQRLVDGFSRDMLAGNWSFNGEPLIIARDGTLNDGQHRCAAVVQAGVTVPVVIIIGVDRESRTTLDQGATRSVGDYLAMDGHVNATALGAAAGMALEWRDRGGLFAGGGYGRPTKSEILHFVASTPAIGIAVSRVEGKLARAMGGHAFLAFCYYAMWSVTSSPEVNEFFAKYLTGEELKAGDPILYVRNRMISEGKFLRRNERAELMFKAWNAHRKGEKRTRIQITGGELPMLEA